MGLCVPMDVHGVGVFYRRFFEHIDGGGGGADGSGTSTAGAGLDTFNRVRTEHGFQSLTESNKPGTAHRTGIYLTPVQKVHPH